jgi:glycosyltransferase involved in cell wall biosynthesis
MSDSKITIDILLATYNGEQFLVHQLDSLLAQTISNFRILVRDDGSSDSTKKILQQYQNKFPDIVRIIEDDLGNIGVAQNFNVLMQSTNAEYLCFCDQDDVWLKNKLEVSLKEIQKLENGNNTVPCMIYSDMTVINEQDEVLHQSMWKIHKTHSAYFTFNRLLVYNIPFGCTMMINQSLAKLAYPIGNKAIYHDHWIALLTAAFGKFKAIDQPLILLRNHANNTSFRIKSSFTQKMWMKIKNAVTKTQHTYWLNLRIEQAKDFKKAYYTKLNKKDQQTLDAFISIENHKGIGRKFIYLKNKFFKPDFLQTAKMILKA